MKKLLAILLTGAIALTFTACNSGDGGLSQADADKPQKEIDRLQDELDKAKGNENNQSGNNNSSDDDQSNSPYASTNVGDIIHFGGYDWLVLDVQNGKALIISDKILTSHKYGYSSIWETSEVREYLNGSFVDNTFTAEEKKLIAEQRIENKSNQWYGTSGGIDTIDKVFLLSLEEVVKYFGDSGQLENRPDSAIYIDDEYNSMRIAVDKDTGKALWWWLRSPGDNRHDAARVLTDGRVLVNGLGVDDINGGVRPALWLNL